MHLVNLQEVAGGKKFLELLLEAVNFTGYHLIRRTLTSSCDQKYIDLKKKNH